MAERDIDVTLFGATSVTGRQIAKYLSQRAPGVDATWAAAARSPEKLSSTLADVGVEGATTHRGGRDRPRFAQGDGRAHQGRPQPRRPIHLLRAPCHRRVHRRRRPYVDLSGEMPFVARTTRDVHAEAEAAGVKIVQVCGFESLPPDMGVALAAHTARERHSEELASAEVTIRTLQLPPGIPRPSDMVSGGTMQSLAQAIGEDDAERLLDPSCMVFDEARCEEIRRTSPIKVAPRRSQDGAVIAPMAPVGFHQPRRHPPLRRPRGPARLHLPRGDGDRRRSRELSLPLSPPPARSPACRSRRQPLPVPALRSESALRPSSPAFSPAPASAPARTGSSSGAGGWT